MELWAHHEKLPLLGEGSFRLPEEAPRLVTLLNRTLKKRGVIFGLRREKENYVFSIYAANGEDSHAGA